MPFKFVSTLIKTRRMLWSLETRMICLHQGCGPLPINNFWIQVIIQNYVEWKKAWMILILCGWCSCHQKHSTSMQSTVRATVGVLLHRLSKLKAYYTTMFCFPKLSFWMRIWQSFLWFKTVKAYSKAIHHLMCAFGHQRMMAQDTMEIRSVWIVLRTHILLTEVYYTVQCGNGYKNWVFLNEIYLNVQQEHLAGLECSE